MHLPYISYIAAIVGSSLVDASPTGTQASLPIVDLGYVKQQATLYNTTGSFYEFSNIAFAQPPIGNLRFAAPKPPLHQSKVQNGASGPVNCYQAHPTWFSTEFFGFGSVQDPADSEDCLYLDVFVPKKIYQHRNSASGGAPVVVWIYGGGNVFGSKTANPPGGLVTQSTTNTSSEGVIFVTMNYRLGYFASLGGPAYQAAGGTQNLGLLDQKLAIQWVRDNIHKFGGDVNRMTLMGESGGATFAGYQLTTPFTSNCTAPFQQAILQSPAQSPLSPNSTLDAYYASFMRALNVSTLAEARALTGAQVQTANLGLVRAWPSGRFLLFPTQDGSLVSNTSTRELLAGNFDPRTKVITSYNDNEGSIFIPNDTSLLKDFPALVKYILPNASPKSIAYISNSLYPPPSPSTPYTNAYNRAELFIGDQLINCAAVGYAQAFHNKGHAYKFSVSSELPFGTGFHTQDIGYTFYNGPSDGVDTGVALDMQSFFLNFAIHGDPNYAKTIKPPMPIYGANHNLLNLTSTGFSLIKDAEVNARCHYWNYEFSNAD